MHHTFDDTPSSRWLNSVSRFLVGSKVSVPLGVICICGSNCVYVIWVLADAHRQRTVNWIDGCGGLSCAFDFTSKAILQVHKYIYVFLTAVSSFFSVWTWIFVPTWLAIFWWEIPSPTVIIWQWSEKVTKLSCFGIVTGSSEKERMVEITWCTRSTPWCIGHVAIPSCHIRRQPWHRIHSGIHHPTHNFVSVVKSFIPYRYIGRCLKCFWVFSWKNW